MLHFDGRRGVWHRPYKFYTGGHTRTTAHYRQMRRSEAGLQFFIAGARRECAAANIPAAFGRSRNSANHAAFGAHCGAVDRCRQRTAHEGNYIRHFFGGGEPLY